MLPVRHVWHACSTEQSEHDQLQTKAKVSGHENGIRISPLLCRRPLLACLFALLEKTSFETNRALYLCWHGHSRLRFVLTCISFLRVRSNAKANATDEHNGRHLPLLHNIQLLMLTPIESPVILTSIRAFQSSH